MSPVPITVISDPLIPSWALFIVLKKKTLYSSPPHVQNKWRPPINFLQNLGDVGQRLPEVVPQVALQQG